MTEELAAAQGRLFVPPEDMKQAAALSSVALLTL